MLRVILLGAILLSYFSEYSMADEISNFTIWDEHGKNTCIADLHCFLSLHESSVYTIKFVLTLDNVVEHPVLVISIENIKEGDVLKTTLTMCYNSSDERVSLVECTCSKTNCKTTQNDGYKSAEVPKDGSGSNAFTVPSPTPKEGSNNDTNIATRPEDNYNSDTNSTATSKTTCSCLVPPGTYLVEHRMVLPKFKDMAFMCVKGHNNTEACRGVVSTLSDWPPLQLHDDRFTGVY